jgi:hypothetical protein
MSNSVFKISNKTKYLSFSTEGVVFFLGFFVTGCGMAASRTGTGISSLEHSAEVVAAYPGVDDNKIYIIKLAIYSIVYIV